MRSPVGLARVAGNARADNIFPIGRSTVVSRYNVVQVQQLSAQCLAAILTRVVVSFKYVESREFDFFLRKSVINHQQYDPGDCYFERDRVDLLC